MSDNKKINDLIEKDFRLKKEFEKIKDMSNEEFKEYTDDFLMSTSTESQILGLLQLSSKLGEDSPFLGMIASLGYAFAKKKQLLTERLNSLENIIPVDDKPSKLMVREIIEMFERL